MHVSEIWEVILAHVGRRVMSYKLQTCKCTWPTQRHDRTGRERTHTVWQRHDIPMLEQTHILKNLGMEN